MCTYCMHLIKIFIVILNDNRKCALDISVAIFYTTRVLCWNFHRVRRKNKLYFNEDNNIRTENVS